MNIKTTLDITILRLSKDANKMKILEEFILSLPEEINKGDEMSRMLTFIKSGDAQMINESISDLTWLQQHIIYELYKILNKTEDKEVVEQRMNEVLPILIEKAFQELFVPSNNEFK